MYMAVKMCYSVDIYETFIAYIVAVPNRYGRRVPRRQSIRRQPLSPEQAQREPSVSTEPTTTEYVVAVALVGRH